MRLKKTKRNNSNIYFFPSSLLDFPSSLPDFPSSLPDSQLLPLPWNLSRLGSHDWDGGVAPERGPLI